MDSVAIAFAVSFVDATSVDTGTSVCLYLGTTMPTPFDNHHGPNTNRKMSHRLGFDNAIFWKHSHSDRISVSHYFSYLHYLYLYRAAVVVQNFLASYNSFPNTDPLNRPIYRVANPH
jgi:hypothetical protein